MTLIQTLYMASLRLLRVDLSLISSSPPIQSTSTIKSTKVRRFHKSFEAAGNDASILFAVMLNKDKRKIITKLIYVVNQLK